MLVAGRDLLQLNPLGAGQCRGPGMGGRAGGEISRTSSPASSRTSRTAASSGSSLGSMWPPGGSHMPSFRCQRRRTLPSWTTNVATVKSRVKPSFP
ncbi:MAG: hypothetical protein A6D92_25630 [Symbiobacterium thermophilum]|uniref:Uncharacterized protein n=1 Tax=Symbiobacterium thermophilum TaxID=2734 RepID=A0A1Y2T488_SYMTR|nr:MAG: hypothetical protein A6D92_25630 [Symbiobacterium thermophilum]